MGLTLKIKYLYISQIIVILVNNYFQNYKKNINELLGGKNMNYFEINIIGPGKVGMSVLNYLCKKEGYKKGKIINSNFNDYDNLNLKDILFVSTQDDILETICYNLKKSNLNNLKAIIHFSGYLDSEVFKDFDVEIKLSMHPNFPFVSKESNLKNVYWGLEGDKKSCDFGKCLVSSLDGRYFLIPKNKKKQYHLAAVITSNFLYALFKMSNDIYDILEIENKDVLIDLCENSLKNIKINGLKNSLTGPVKRNDSKIINEESVIFEKIFEDKNVYNFFIKKLYEIKENGGE